ncbi:hypothetical protein ACTFIR_012794 [Dictyostelium discoideum]
MPSNNSRFKKVKHLHQQPIIQDGRNQESTINGQTSYYMVKLDIKKAYLHVLVDPQYRGLFRFVWKGSHYRWKTMPFGLSTAPSIFTMLLRPVVLYSEVSTFINWLKGYYPKELGLPNFCQEVVNGLNIHLLPNFKPMPNPIPFSIPEGPKSDCITKEVQDLLLDDAIEQVLPNRYSKRVFYSNVFTVPKPCSPIKFTFFLRHCFQSCSNRTDRSCI